MSVFSSRSKTNKKAESSTDTSSKKPKLQPGDLMVSRHPDLQNKNILKKLLRKFKNLYSRHRVALMLVTILFLGGGGYAVYTSFAATTCDHPDGPTAKECYATNTYSNWRTLPKAEGYSSVEWDMQVDNYPSLADGDNYYWSTSFQLNPSGPSTGGYFGFHPYNGESNNVIFSIWNHPKDNACPGSVNNAGNLGAGSHASPGPGAEKNYFDCEGQGWSLRLKYRWVVGRKYHFKIVRFYVPPEATLLGAGPTGNYYRASIKDTVSGEEKTLGSIKPVYNTTGIGGDGNLGNFTEYLGSTPAAQSCNDVSYVSTVFGPPIWGDNTGLLRLPTIDNGDLSYQGEISGPRRYCSEQSQLSHLPDGSIRHEIGSTVRRRPLPSVPPPYTPVIHHSFPTPPPPPPRCTNGNLIVAWMHCDDGGWYIYFSNTWAGKPVEMWKNAAGQCGTKTGIIPGSLVAQSGYFYPANCGDSTVLLNWIQASAIREIAIKAQRIQDTKPLKPAGYGTTKTSDPVFNRISMRTGNMRTWSEWEKVDQGPYLGYLAWFIPLDKQFGLANYNTTKDLNYMGNIWGYDEGRFVAATNMAGGTKKTDRPFVYGPFERPGGNVQEAFAGGKVMKVCWSVRDLLAAETNGAQHSKIQLRVTSNQGTVDWMWGRPTEVQLTGTTYKQYCHDNIKLPYGVVNPDALEYPAHYVSGAVAVSDIERTIYYPEGSYSVALPNYGSFGKQLGTQPDPLIKQANTPTAKLTVGQCEAASTISSAFGPLGVGCKLTANTSVSITSRVFGAKKNGNKNACVIAKIKSGEYLYGYVYADGATTAQQRFTFTFKGNIEDGSGRATYCADTKANTFGRIVISTSVTDANNPAIIERLTVN